LTAFFVRVGERRGSEAETRNVGPSGLDHSLWTSEPKELSPSHRRVMLKLG